VTNLKGGGREGGFIALAKGTWGELIFCYKHNFKMKMVLLGLTIPHPASPKRGGAILTTNSKMGGAIFTLS
jgi:hypothetical protein